MTNEEIYLEMVAISKLMSKLLKENRLDERNNLVPKWRWLYRSYDFGFSVGDEIETIAWGRHWKLARVIEHDKVDNSFLIKNDRGWEVIVPGMSLRHVRGEIEQLELF